MCTVVAKHFDKLGWVIAKNRDQDYVSDISFDDKIHKNVGEILILDDHDTGYKEGMNYKGLTIITASLTPNLDDETDRADGTKIYDALKLETPEKAADYLVKHKLTGFLFIANSDKFVLVEAGRTNDDKGGYHSKVRVVPKTEIVVRTNHGVDLAWAGFQYGIDEQQDIWRKSSESRKKLAEKVAKTAKDPVALLDGLASKMVDDLQMNVFRIESKPKQMRTIFQWALIPSKNVAIVRPIQCKMKVRVSKEKIKIDVLDNTLIKKTYDGKVKHFSKLKITQNKDYIMAVQEQLLRFKEFIGNDV